MMIVMKLGEDDQTHHTDAPQEESPEGSGKYYYDDSTGYELYQPTDSLEDDEAEDEATDNGAA